MHNSTSVQKLLLPINKPSTVRYKMICFPCAGGNASMFQDWPNKLPDELEVLALNAPGRASRFLEEAYTSMESLVADLICEASILRHNPYILYGHSLGARVAYEFAKQAIALGYPGPIHFIASGSRSPDTPCFSTPTYNLPIDKFLDTLRYMQGTPQEILDNDEFMQLLLPTLRADFQMAEKYIGEVSQLLCPISVYGGKEDPNIGLDKLKHWENYTCSGFEISMFDGGHFFINDNPKPLQSLHRLVQKIMNDYP
jgi:medium-chain acyl-[acyl-carrier-protein] hydrolase